jgi:hypothetical protein
MIESLFGQTRRKPPASENLNVPSTCWSQLRETAGPVIGLKRYASGLSISGIIWVEPREPTLAPGMGESIFV